MVIKKMLLYKDIEGIFYAHKKYEFKKTVKKSRVKNSFKIQKKLIIYYSG